MATTSYTSRRQYLTQDELASFAGLTISNATQADTMISEAEELIDAYVGAQDKFLDNDFANVIEGKAQAGGTTTLTLESRHSNVFLTNFFTYCEIEIVGGAGAGQRTIIASSTYPNTIVTFRDAFTTACDSTSIYRIYQLGKYPRKRDVYLDAINPPSPIYYKNIPENIKRATAAQVEYMLTQGYNFFETDDIYKIAEKIGDYEYQKPRDSSGSGLNLMIGPKAKMFLVGYVNRKGRIIV